MMRSFVALLGAELRTQFRKTGTYVFALMYAAIGLLIMLAIGGTFESVQIGVGSGNVKVDGPFTIVVLSLVWSLFATLNIAAISGNAACRDVEEGMHPLVYSAPTSKWALLGSRWLGSLLASAFIVSAIPASLLLGAKLPVLEPERVGAWSLMHGVVALLGWILPNLVFTSSLFFGLAALTRRMFPNYIGGVVLLVGYLGSSAITADLDNKTFAAMIDPFGLGAFEHMTDYWSPHARNTVAVWPAGVALANRALWTAVGLGVLLGGIALAKLDQDGRQWSLRLWKREAPVVDAEQAAQRDNRVRDVEVPAFARRFDGATRFAQGRALASRALSDVLGHRYFWAFVTAAVLFQLLNAQVIGTMYGTDTWPVTYQVIEVLEGTLGLFLLVVLTFYAGDLVWHERDLGTSSLYDSLPIPDVLPLVAKAIALFAVIAGMHVTVLVMGVLVQAWSGYFHFELPLYLQWLFGLSLLEWLPYVALALAVHAVIDQKVLGHLVLICFWVWQSFRAAMGFEYNVWWFGSTPGRTYSDMNGWGWYLGPFFVYCLYWLAVGVLLLGLARLMWVRGAGSELRTRLQEARRRLDRPTSLVLGGSALMALALGAYIVVNTSVLRPFTSTVEQARQQVRYEKQYKAEWESAPHPKVVDVDLTVDLFPRRGELAVSGELLLENQTGSPISRMLLSMDNENELDSLSFDVPHQVAMLDEDLAMRTVTFEPPLQPGARTTLSYALHRPERGFRNQGANTEIVPNGSFVNAVRFLPTLGYERGFEIAEKAQRRKYDLPERPRMLDLDDPAARARNYISDDADRTPVQILVRTDRGQVALAPGALVEKGEEGDRAWFRYQTVRPILHFYSVLSGEWSQKVDKWNDIDIEVYYDPRHDWNIDRMIDGTKKSLAEFTESFGPFQYGEIRIVEFPRYATFAQSFPSTVPYSEAIGFIARLEDPDEDVDYPFYVTAHEVAHQWWAHQVIGADAQGGTVLSETLAQYSAMKVMHNEYGSSQIHRFLRYEADRYFMGRATETDREVPLLRVENQPYIHYNKGAIVMWALREAVGEERLDAALRKFLDQTRDVGPPYPTARDLLEVLKAELPGAHDLLHDSFERIVLYENRPTSAVATRREDGKYVVKLDLTLEKTVADDVGEESPVDFSEPVEIGVFSGTEDDRKVLFLRRQLVTGPTAQIEVVVDELPTLAGVDPNHLLLDRSREDNLMAVTLEE
jgi:ABC-2 type transport system permease protein